MKRLLSVLLSVAMMLSLLPISVLASEPDVTLTLGNGEVTIESGKVVEVPLKATVAEGKQIISVGATVEFDDPNNKLVVTDFVVSNEIHQVYVDEYDETREDLVTRTFNKGVLGIATTYGITFDESNTDGVIGKFKFKAMDGIYNGTYTATIADKVIIRDKATAEKMSVVVNPLTITVTGGKDPTLTNVSLTKGDETVLAMGDTWSYDVAVDGVNDQAFTVATFAEDAANNISLNATWTENDDALTFADGIITVDKMASVGAHKATASYGGVNKEFTFNVTHDSKFTDVVAKVGDEVVEEIALPMGDATTTPVALAARDQFGDPITGSVIYALANNELEGVSLSGSEITVSFNAKDNKFTEDNKLTVGFSAKVGETTKEGSFDITRDAPQAATVEVFSKSAETIKFGAAADVTGEQHFTAIVKDQYGHDTDDNATLSFTATIDNETVTFATTEIELVDGYVKVHPAASSKIGKGKSAELTITAAFGDAAPGTAENKVTVARETASLTTIEVGGLKTLSIPATGAADTTANYTVTYKDQFGAEMTNDEVANEGPYPQVGRDRRKGRAERQHGHRQGRRGKGQDLHLDRDEDERGRQDRFRQR